ncbi:hypothetical protein M2271_004146 [Streptomyces sp. LBL]|nr:hypothetical protein [Streptomyces sp. LBL]
MRCDLACMVRVNAAGHRRASTACCPRSNARRRRSSPPHDHRRLPEGPGGGRRVASGAPACQEEGPASGKLYDSALGLVLIHVAFQSGFCAFALSNYVRSLPHELTEAALVDGASVWRMYWQIVLPLCKPAMAALATLLSIWIYNDFFWAIVLISTGENMPITSALNNLSGQYFTDPNLVAAGALLTAIPTLIVYFVLQRQFVSGLTLGANKG